MLKRHFFKDHLTAQLTEAVEYTDCMSAEEFPPPKEHPGYDINQSDGKAPIMMKLWGIRGTPSLPLLPGPLWPGVVAPDRILSMAQISNWVSKNDICQIELLEIELFDHLTVCRQMIDV